MTITGQASRTLQMPANALGAGLAAVSIGKSFRRRQVVKNVSLSLGRG